MTFVLEQQYFGCGKETANEIETVRRLYFEMDAALRRPFQANGTICCLTDRTYWQGVVYDTLI
jgi:hypothetical protein